jgi:hypothetical protein
MGYDVTIWRRRIAERTDLSSYVTHLTRAQDNKSLAEVLLSIVSDQKIRGSDPAESFIHGEQRAVCFMDAPLSGICQNASFEKKYACKNPNARIRYKSCGVMFEKSYVYSRGGRPVIYDRTADAKKYLPENEWWRIVNLDLTDEDNIIDWTHEREWRVPGAFKFDIKETTVLLPNQKVYREFIQECPSNVLSRLGGLIVLDRVLY